jgi:hypothetical protein
VNDVFEYPPVNSPAIKSLCASTSWNESVVFTCDESSGGIAELRNAILNCVRYAIAAGGSLVIPTIVVRGDNGVIGEGNNTGFQYVFDQEHFVASMAQSCPQMRIYASVAHIPNLKDAYGPVSIVPEYLVRKTPEGGVAHPEAWPGLFYNWLGQYVVRDAKGPILVELGRSFLQYPISSDGEEFAQTFGKILNFHPEFRILATIALIKLSQAYSLQLQLTKSILKRAFLGAYLSIENPDSKDVKFDPVSTSYAWQSILYLSQATHSNISLIYVASDKGSNIAKFISDAKARNIAVTSKFDLLKGEDREDLLEMSKDQQAIVDYLVLLKASEFGGVGHSSLAWNVALKRHQWAVKMNALDGPLMFNDELSWIYGPLKENPQFAASMWP